MQGNVPVLLEATHPRPSSIVGTRRRKSGGRGVAIVAAILGFGGVAIVSAGIAKILFFVFIVLFLVSLITHMSRRV